MGSRQPRPVRARHREIAAGAVREVHGAGGGPRRVLGVTVSGSELDEDSNAKVEARLYGRTATVRVEMTARYPDPIRGIAAEVRRIVIERLRVLADVEASLVDVEVSVCANRARRGVTSSCCASPHLRAAALLLLGAAIAASAIAGPVTEAMALPVDELSRSAVLPVVGRS